MSKPLDRCTKAELITVIHAKDAQLASQNVLLTKQDHQITVLQGKLMAATQQVDALALAPKSAVCYQCGQANGPLSERSRCVYCECGRSKANEAENEQLRSVPALMEGMGTTISVAAFCKDYCRTHRVNSVPFHVVARAKRAGVIA